MACRAGQGLRLYMRPQLFTQTVLVAGWSLEPTHGPFLDPARDFPQGGTKEEGRRGGIYPHRYELGGNPSMWTKGGGEGAIHMT